MRVLTQLAAHDLHALVQGLRSGRLSAPFTALAVEALCPGVPAAAVVGELQELAGQDIPPQHLAVVLEAAAMAHVTAEARQEKTEVVWTGPEQPGSAARDTSAVVRELFATARHDVLVSSFAVYQGNALFQPLADQMDRDPNLRVRIFLDVHRGAGDTSADSELVQRASLHFQKHEWPGTRLPEVYFYPRSLEMNPATRASLHAKIVVVDRARSFITSANVTEAAQQRNIEIGVLVDSERLAMKIHEHFDGLARTGVLRRLFE